MYYNMKNYIFGLASLALIVSACDDYNDNFEGLDEMVKKAGQNVKAFDITLDQNYSSSDEANEAIIKYITSTYPSYDNGSAIKVTYNLATDAPEYISQITSAQSLTIDNETYTDIWGVDDIFYFTPSKNAATFIPSILKDKFAQAVEGDRVIVSYNFSNNEPSTNTETKETTWMPLDAQFLPSGTSWNYTNTGDIDLSDYVGQKIRIGMRYTSTADAAATIEVKQFSVNEPNGYGNTYVFYLDTKNNVYKISSKPGTGSYLILAQVGVDKYVPFGKIIDNKNYGYSAGDTLTAVNGTFTVANVEQYVVTIDSTDTGVSLKNADGKYLYMKGTYDSLNVADELQTEGSDWTITLSDDGTMAIKNILVEKTVKFGHKYGNFGGYDESKWNTTTYFSNSLLGTTLPDGFSLVDVNVPDGGASVWSFDSKYGFKATAYISNVNYASETWIISPEIDLTAATVPVVSTNIAGQYFGTDRTASDCFRLFVTTNYDETAKWNTGNKAANLNAGQEQFALYQFNGSKWVESTDAVVVNPTDYNAMGSNYSNFSATFNADTYLAKFLSNHFPYALLDESKTVVYNYYDSSSKITSIRADIYTFNDTTWVKGSNYQPVTSQFVRTGGKWIFDPSVVLNYPRDADESAAFFQVCTDWVWDNIDTKLGCTTKGQGYVTSYANNEYYSGCSAYQKDVDWRPAKARDQYAAGFTGNDADDLALMQQHLIEVLGGVLEQQYASAKTINDVDIFYTINFVAYDGANHDYTIKYKLVADGKFEYVEDSLAPIE